MWLMDYFSMLLEMLKRASEMQNHVYNVVAEWSEEKLFLN